MQQCRAGAHCGAFGRQQFHLAGRPRQSRATFTDNELANLDAFYSTNIKGVHDDYFGGLSDVDGNGRFLVLMTKEVNRDENAVGLGLPPDLVARQYCPTSNQAEIFYGRVPDPRGSVGDTVTKQALLDYYPSLIAPKSRTWCRAKPRSWRMQAGRLLGKMKVVPPSPSNSSPIASSGTVPARNLAGVQPPGPMKGGIGMGSGSATWLLFSDEIGVETAPEESPALQRSAAGLATKTRATPVPALGSPCLRRPLHGPPLRHGPLGRGVSRRRARLNAPPHTIPGARFRILG